LFMIVFAGLSRLSPLNQLGANFNRFLSRIKLWHIVVTCFGLAAGLAWWETPIPTIHDELSYLLAADTFASGRVTNPTHPLWVFFESFHIIHEPSYQSKYLPGQGMVLATGILLARNPFVGLWLFLCLGLVVLYWALRAWLPRNWSIFGTLICGLTLAIGDISQSLMFNPLAFIGSALVLGATKRMVADAKASVWNFRHLVERGALWGLGAALLMHSRPFEGCGICLAFLTWLLFEFFRSPLYRWRRFATAGVPALAVAAIGLGLILGYNRAVTGDYWTSPYEVHDNRYLGAPVILWQKMPNPPVGNHPVIDSFNQEGLRKTLLTDWQLASPVNFLAANCAKLWRFVKMYTSFALLPLLLLGISVFFRRRHTRLLAVAFSVVHLVTVVSTSQWIPSYGMPVLPMAILVMVWGARRLVRWRGGDSAEGWRFASALTVTYALSLLAVVPFRAQYLPGWANSHKAYHIVESELAKVEGNLVVVVQYDEPALLKMEYVHNAADIDASRVVFARDMGEEKNKELFQYYADRKVVYLGIKNEKDPETKLVFPVYRFRITYNPYGPARG
jgi:hypothetical protein